MGRQFLALGDSYTIGEAVPEDQRWPVQLVTRLNRREFHFDPPEIIATTGWTTDELAAAMDAKYPAGTRADFDLVSLLIGVNNQYRGRALDEYREQFTALLTRALALAAAEIAQAHGIRFVDTSHVSRERGAVWVADDGLHPSGALYTAWAEAAERALLGA